MKPALAAARAAIDQCIEVYVDCPLEVRVARDPKGIYRRGRLGHVTTVPGLQTAYEIIGALEARGYVGPPTISTSA